MNMDKRSLIQDINGSRLEKDYEEKR